MGSYRVFLSKINVMVFFFITAGRCIFQKYGLYKPFAGSISNNLFIHASLSFFILFSCHMKDRRLVEFLTLNQGWEFRQIDHPDSTWYPATVPGTIHTDLLKNRLIPDPFYGCNEVDLQWIGRSDWVYRTTFRVEANMLKRNHVRLVFEGLDTYAKVFVNGEKLLEANNMFRKWEVECRKYIREGENLMEIVFESAENRFIKDSLALGYPLPGGRWNLSRKAAYHFGWDWGPKFITCGIWKSVYLECHENHRPLEIQLFTEQISEKLAFISAELSVHSEINEQASLTIMDNTEGKVLVSKKLELSPQQLKYDVPFSIQNPVLWWCRGLGEPHLYELDVELRTNSGYVWKEKISYGLRTIDVVSENDENGQSLFVKLNGVPVFMKGANYIPQHSFVTEISDDDYLQIVERAVNSNMNMLRVWGGGIYEKDIFYELCSRNGILVWQDFMFACAMYPGDDAFIENVREEAVGQVKRLRNNACLAMWCGNNEADEGWHNWQWQKTHKISQEDSAKIWEAYKKIFRDLLPGIVNSYDQGRFYQSTSPMIGWGRKESLTHGSAHYWGVWWGREPFDKYLEKVPRFMSEFGFQAMPALSTIRHFQDTVYDFLFSNALKCHQKHPTGYPTIGVYLDREGLYPETLEDYIFMSQLIQAHGIGLAVEAHRRAMPYCMGSLYWQLNDCWPVTSWSGADVNGNWKALQYTIRKLYDEVLVSLIINDGNCEIYIISDKLSGTTGQLTATIVNFEGIRECFLSKEINAHANVSQMIMKKPVGEILSGKAPGSHLIEATFTTEERKIYSNSKFVTTFGSLKLENAEITKKITEVQGGFHISLTSNVFVAHVQLYLTENHVWFDDNFFHLWPGKEKVVFCRSSLYLHEIIEQLRMMSLNDVKVI